MPTAYSSRSSKRKPQAIAPIMPVRPEVEAEQRTVGCQHFPGRHLVPLEGRGGLEAAEPDLEPVVVVQVDVGVEQVEAVRAPLERDLILERPGHPAAEIEPCPGEVEVADDGTHVRIVIDPGVGLEQGVETQLEFLIVGLEQVAVALLVVDGIELDAIRWARRSAPGDARGAPASSLTVGAVSSGPPAPGRRRRPAAGGQPMPPGPPAELREGRAARTSSIGMWRSRAVVGKGIAQAGPARRARGRRARRSARRDRAVA